MIWSAIHQLNILVEFDVAGRDLAFLVHRKHQRLLIAGVGLEFDLLQVQHDVGDIFHDALDGGELVHRAVQFDGRDGRAFERAEQHAAQGIADGVTVAGFKRLGHELGVSGCGG